MSGAIDGKYFIMKFKKLFGCLALSSLLALGVGVGLSAGKNEVKEVKAAQRAAGIEVRFNLPTSWTTEGGGEWVASNIYLHTWIEDGAETSWPGHSMTFSYKNEGGDLVYSFVSGTDTNQLYDKMIFNDGNGHKLAEVAAPTVSTGYYWNGESFGTYNLTSTYYFCDANWALGSNPKVYAYNADNPEIKNAVKPGVAMSKIYTNNDGVYTFDLDVKYNTLEFGNGVITQEGISTQGHSGKTFYFAGVDSPSNAWWNDLDSVFADNFEKNYMHMNDYDKDGTIGSTKGTGLCSTYYPLARDAYQDYINDTGSDMGQHIMEKLSDYHSDCLTRLSEWARINGQTFTVTDKIGSFSLNADVLSPLSTESSNNSVIIIVTISVISLAAIGGYFLLRRRKED